MVGSAEGRLEGINDGDPLGQSLGLLEGTLDGSALGWALGNAPFKNIRVYNE